MENAPSKPSPFVSVDQLPLHRAPPLAPSQELAYRKKCIQLKRRLKEIEDANDATRSRIEKEKSQINKLRLNRAILLQHLKELMDAPSNKVSKSDIHRTLEATNGIGRIAERIGALPRHPQSEYLLEDSTDETEDETLAQVSNPLAVTHFGPKENTSDSRERKAPGETYEIPSEQPCSQS